MIQLELYLKEISNFLRTLTIKNTFFADHMLETWVKEEYRDVVKDDYTLHPYYRNLTGDYILFDYTALEQAYGIYPERCATQEEYYEKQAEIIDLAENTYGLSRQSYILSPSTGERSLVPNEKIYNYCNDLPIINSFDTQKKIPFTKSILTSADEINTAEIYKIPNSRYYKLIERYPLSADVIKAIVYPIQSAKVDGVLLSPIDRAYNAKNFELLAYDKTQLEESEFQSIYECIQGTLDMVRRRYAINEYCFEAMYPQAHQYILWQILYLAIFVERITNIRTGNVHSYHLWSYLKSHGMGEYRDILTTRQQNFLYRNLPYLLEHKGTQHALEILTYILLTSQNISLEGKNTIQRTTSIEGDNNIVDTAQKSPAIQSISVGKPMLTGIAEIYAKDPNTRFQTILDYIGRHAGENNENDQQEYRAGYTEATSTIYDKERSAGLEYQDDYRFDKSSANCDSLISSAAESYRNTKLLELISNSSSDLYSAVYSKFFAESLVYRVSLGDTKFSISFTPKDSATTIVLPISDALGILFYVLNKANKNKLPDSYPADYDNCGQPSQKFDEEIIERPFYHGKRIYETYKILDKPPTKFKVEWPYKTIFDGVVQDFPALPESFYWNEQTYLSKGFLNSSVTAYTLNMNDKEYRFEIEDASADPTLRRWISTEDYFTMEYYSSRCFWVIRDKHNTVYYRTEYRKNFSLDVENMVWYDKDMFEVDLNIRAVDKQYVIDSSMHNYSGVFHNVTDFSGKIHNQCLSFLGLYLEDNSNASSTYHEMYETIKKDRCVSSYVELNLLDGKTYTEYLESDDENIVALKAIFDEYDKSVAAELNYSNLADTIVAAMMPVEDSLLSISTAAMNDKYTKLIKLFKSMIAYNLAFIESTYNAVNSTVFRPLKEEAHKRLFIEKHIERSDYVEDCRTKFWDVFVPTYIGQSNVVYWLTDDLTLDQKVAIIDNVDKLIPILDSRYTTKVKKTKLKKVINDTVVVNYLINTPVEKIMNLQYIKKKIKKETCDDVIKDIDDVSDIFIPGKVITMGGKTTTVGTARELLTLINN